MMQGLMAGVAGATLTLGIVGSLGAPAALAAPPTQILPTTTTVQASPSTIVSSQGTTAGSYGNTAFVPQSTKITATVSIALVNGLLVTPGGLGGNVGFMAQDREGDVLLLGSVPVSSCLLIVHRCTATVPSNAFFVSPADATLGATNWLVTAIYSGDLLSKGSNNSTTVVATTGNESSCITGEGCYTAAVNGDGSAEIQLYAPCFLNCGDPPGTFNQYVGFGGPTMTACAGGNNPVDGNGVSTNGVLAFPTYASTPTNPMEIVYSLFGPTAIAQESLPDPNSICYSASQPFVTANGTVTPYDPVSQEYEGALAACNGTDSNLPCYYNSYSTPGTVGPPSYSDAYFTIDIYANVDGGPGKH
jgi:hypothetical protein